MGGLSARDVARLTDFEGPGYRVVPLRVRTAGAMTTVSVFEPVQSRLQPKRRAMGPGALAAPPQAGVRRPPEARPQRAPGVFQAVTWIAEQ